MIRYANIIGESIVDGPGLRVAVFLQGCPRHCNGCHNSALLSPDGGIVIEEKELVNLIQTYITPLHKGITFSGGDPLLQHQSLLKVVLILRQNNPTIDIWVYTGYLFEEVKHLPIIHLIDYLVDGPFYLDKKDLSLKFRGSSNQRIIDVIKSLQNETVLEKEL